MLYEGLCPKCGKEVKREFKSQSDMKGFKGFCSGSCANSRVMTESHRMKTSTSIKRSLFNQGTLLCEHGCGSPALFAGDESRKYCCSESSNSCPAVISKASKGLKKAYKDGRKAAWNTHPAAGFNRFQIVKPDSEVFTYGSDSNLAKNRFLRRATDLKCSECGVTSWLGKPLRLHVDHINGDRQDNRIENLRLLCPNCHSQTETYCRDASGRKLGRKVTDDQILAALQVSTSISKAARLLGVSASQGWTYERFRRVMEVNNFKFPEIKPVQMAL